MPKQLVVCLVQMLFQPQYFAPLALPYAGELVASENNWGEKASEVGLAVGLPLDVAPRHDFLVWLLLQELTPDLVQGSAQWVRMEDPGSFGSGSRICWIAGGLGSRIQDLLDPGSG